MRKASIIISICTMIAVSLTLYAQTVTDLKPIMTQVGPANTSLTATMKDRNMTASDIAKEADKLQDLFKQVASFMKDHKADDGVGWATDASNAAGDLSKAAKLNDYDAMKTAQAKIAKQCKSCHDVHRDQLPDKSFKFKN